MMVSEKNAGTGQLDRVLSYMAFAASSQPLSVLLDEAPRKIAECVNADIVSLYLLEGDGRTMVMRGNVGFPAGARGKVRLELGEGLTGHAVEACYPVASERAPEHARFRPFPELEEDRFPAFAALPIVGRDGALGAVVVQRSADHPFSEAEVSLVVALTAPISAAVSLARLLDDLRGDADAPTGSGTRKVTLCGTPLVRGKSMGAIAAIRRPAVSPEQNPAGNDGELLEAAMEQAQKELAELARRAAERGLGSRAQFIDSYLLMLNDQRLKKRSLSLLGEGEGLASALGKVAREAARAANKDGDDFLINRARDLEQLCDALFMLAAPAARAELPAKAVVVAETLSIYDLLISQQSRPAGVILTDHTCSPRTRVLLELLDVPAIGDVVGALRWISPGDVSLVDADHGLLTINPSRADIAGFRRERRNSQPGTASC